MILFTFIVGISTGYIGRGYYDSRINSDEYYKKRLDQTVYMINYRIPHTDKNKIIYVTRKEENESMLVADDSMFGPNNTLVYTFKSDSSVQLHPPFYTYKDYIVAPVVKKGDHHDYDLLISTIDGNVITPSVIDNNSGLNGWIISFKGEVIDGEKYIFKIKASYDENNKKDMYLNISTGKIVEQFN